MQDDHDTRIPLSINMTLLQPKAHQTNWISYKLTVHTCTDNARDHSRRDSGVLWSSMLAVSHETNGNLLNIKILHVIRYPFIKDSFLRSETNHVYLHRMHVSLHQIPISILIQDCSPFPSLIEQTRCLASI